MLKYTVVALVRLEVVVSFTVEAWDEYKAREIADAIAGRLMLKWEAVPLPGGLPVATVWQESDQTASVEDIDPRD